MISNALTTERFFEYLERNAYTDDSGTKIPSVPLDCLALFNQFPKLEVTEDLTLNLYEMFKTENYFKELGAETEQLFTWYLKKTLQQACTTYIPKMNIYLEKFNSRLLDRKISIENNETTTYNLTDTDKKDTDNTNTRSIDGTTNSNEGHIEYNTDSSRVDRALTDTVNYGETVTRSYDEYKVTDDGSNCETYNQIKEHEERNLKQTFDTTDTTTIDDTHVISDYLNPTVDASGNSFVGLENGTTTTVTGGYNSPAIVQGSQKNKANSTNELKKDGSIGDTGTVDKTKSGNMYGTVGNKRTYEGSFADTKSGNDTRIINEGISETIDKSINSSKTNNGTNKETVVDNGNVKENATKTKGGTVGIKGSKESVYAWFKSDPELLEQVMNLKNIFIDCLHYFDKLFMYTV